MGRMHTPGKGMSRRALPYKRSPPSWLKVSASEVTDTITKLARKGNTPSQIGVILRDSHGVAQVSSVTGSKVLRILKAHGLAAELPEDLYFLIKKAVSGHKFVNEGAWDSIHVVEVSEGADKKANYKLTTTVMLSMDVHKAAVGDSNLSGSLTRMAEKNCVLDDTHPHVANIGTMIEDMETDIRTYLDSLYIQKTKEVVSSIRKLHKGPTQDKGFTMNLNSAVLKHGANRKVDCESEA